MFMLKSLDHINFIKKLILKCIIIFQRLYQAGEKRWGTDENTFNMILASQSYEQCRAVFDAYAQISKKDIEHAIRSEMSGDVSNGLATIGEFLYSTFKMFILN